MYLGAGTAQAMVFIIAGLILVAILLRVLVIVHRQAGRVRELEARMKAFDNIEAMNETKEKKNG